MESWMGKQAWLFKQEDHAADDSRSELEVQADVHGKQPPKEITEEVTGPNLNRLRIRQHNKCYYTGEELTLGNVSIDHKKPLSKGGKHVISNIASCLQEVNRMKRQMTEDEFIETCSRVSQHSRK